MPYYNDEHHLVGSRSRSRGSAYSVSSEEFEEVVSGGTSPMPLARQRLRTDPPPTTASPAPAPREHVIQVDVPFGYYADPKGYPSLTTRTSGTVTAQAVAADASSSSVRKSSSRRKNAGEVAPSPSPRGYYPHEVDITAPPHSSHETTRKDPERARRLTPDTASTSEASSSGEEAVDHTDGEEEAHDTGSSRRAQPVGMFGVLATENDARMHEHALHTTNSPPFAYPRETDPEVVHVEAPAQPLVPPISATTPTPPSPHQQEQLQPRHASSPQPPLTTTPQPVLLYTSPFLALDANYVHSSLEPSLNPSDSATSSAYSNSDWAVSACGEAVPNQCCVCLLSSVVCCVALPCLIAKERQMLLFNDIEGRYVCCAGILPCCIPDPRVRPELYVTIAPPHPCVLKGKYGIYPDRSMPTSGMGEVAVANVTDKVNGLPQFGCYHRAGREEGRPAPQNGQRGGDGRHDRLSYAPNDLDLAPLPFASPQTKGGTTTTCCCGCFVYDSMNNMCMCTCDSGGCLSCRHPTACCARCPLCCLGCEVCCCVPCAALGNRMLLRQHYGLKPDVCADVPVIGCYRCLRTCFLCASPSRVSASSRGGGAIIGCCGSPNPNTCCAECAYSVSTLLAACCCFSPCVACAMAQHRDQIERLGYPLLSSFSPPDISGMT